MNPIKLDVRGIGDVPSFKNNKMIARGRLITNPKRQKWMEHCIQLIESQLNYAMQTSAGETLTGQQALCWIAQSLPCDDSRSFIPELHITAVDCTKGEEGATITIERIG